MTEACQINNLERVLLATDGSEFSEGAVKVALSLASGCASKLLAISIVEANEEFASEAPQLVEKAEAEAAESLESIRSRAAEAGVDCDTAVHTGDSTYQIIVAEAKKNGSELIIMGRRGRSGIMKVAMGSVTARVIGHAPCDVLVAPRDSALEFKKILIATDGSSHSETAASEGIKMAGKMGGSIIALSVATSDAKAGEAASNVDQVAQLAEEAGIGCEKVTPTGKPYMEIVEAATLKNADLIVVGTHGRTGLAKLLMGSVAERVIGHATCAVLVAASA